MKKLILSTLLSFSVVAPTYAQESQIFLEPGTNYNPRQANSQNGGSAGGQIFLEPGTNYDNRGARVNNFLRQQSFATTNKIEAGTVHVSIVHPDYLEPHQFGLLMSKANSTTGCTDYSPLEYEAKYIEGHYLDIEVKHYRQNIKATQNPQFDCDTSSKVISGMMIFDANDLKQRGVRQLRFNNGQARDTYNVTILDKAVRFTPQSMIAFKAQNLQGIDKSYIQYDFVDDSILKLQVPMAENGDNIAQAVRDLAYRHALEPIFKNETIDVEAENNVFYFRDNSGKTAQDIGEAGYTEFGTINVARPYDGPNGRVAMPVPLKVFLTRQNITL